MTTLVLRRASPAPGVEVDLVVAGGHVVAGLPPGERWEVDLAGRPVLPGLADHHVHLLALAAAATSVDCSPAALAAGGGLARTLRAARARRPHGWLRAVGYDVATSGPLDADRLAAIGVGPVRVQDRTGSRWVLDRDALARVLPADPRDWPAGVERSPGGKPTGVLVRLDRWLVHRVPGGPPDLAGVGRQLAARGVTAVTDAGAANGPAELALLAAAGLPQRVTAMTGAVDVAPVAGVALGPVKVLLDDTDLPPRDVLAQRVADAHRRGRAVAVHCVTDVQLALALAAGLDRRDRVEHASLVPAEALPVLAAAGPTAVLQPGLVLTRGDRYRAEVDGRDREALHRLASLAAAGVPVAAGSDAPYGPADPWDAVAAAVDRRTRAGAVLGPAEAVTPVEAVGLWAGRPDAPATRRRLVPGHPADIVVLDDGWDRLAARPEVAATLVAGEVVAGALPA